MPRDDFSAPIKRTVAARAGYRCSNPKCRKQTSGPQADPAKAVNIGVAAHITAASQGGPRYDPELTSEERGSIDNTIWLCQTCAKLIDSDEPRYSVTIGFGCAPDRTEELVKALFREIEALKTDGPTGEDVDDAREALMRSHETDLAQNGRLVGAITEAYENGEDVSTFFGVPTEYAKLTVASVREAARRYLDTENYVRVTLLPEEDKSGSGL